MLARNEGYHLVEDGTVTAVECAALVELRDRLQRGEIKQWQPEAYPLLSSGLSFAMNRWRVKHSCGTVGCIAGLCYELSDGKAFPFVNGSPYSLRQAPDNLRLCKLFLPTHQERRTAQEAVHALTTFLATGEAEWSNYCIEQVVLA